VVARRLAGRADGRRPPERATTLTLLTPAGLTDPDAGAMPDLADPDDLWSAMFVDPAARAAVEPDHDDPDEVAQLELEGETRRRLSEGATAGEELERALAAITCPTLVIGAKRDLIVPNGVSDR
jgi:pimeloyl-ACP methyl ester carboxylesterase